MIQVHQITHFPGNKPIRRTSRDQLLALKKRVLPYYRPISEGKKFDQRSARLIRRSAL